MKTLEFIQFMVQARLLNKLIIFGLSKIEMDSKYLMLKKTDTMVMSVE